MARPSIFLTAEQFTGLKAEAANRGVSPVQCAAEMLTRWLGRHPKSVRVHVSSDRKPVRLSISLPEESHRSMRILAMQAGSNFSELAAHVIAQRLARAA